MYVMCLYQAIDALRSAQMSNAASIQMLDQHFDGSIEEIHSKTSAAMPKPDQQSTCTEQAIENVVKSDGPVDVAHVGNLTDLDEISLAKSIEDLSHFPVPNVKRSSTFTITKNELINLARADSGEMLATTTDNDPDHGAGPSHQFQNFMESHSRPVSTATNASVEIGGYQNAIEIVLTLLLEAEEILSEPMPDIAELSEAKAQFQSHEEFMIKLSEYQEYVGGALEEGARLLSEPTTNTGLTIEDQQEIKQQVSKVFSYNFADFFIISFILTDAFAERTLGNATNQCTWRAITRSLQTRPNPDAKN